MHAPRAFVTAIAFFLSVSFSLAVRSRGLLSIGLAGAALAAPLRTASEAFATTALQTGSLGLDSELAKRDLILHPRTRADYIHNLRELLKSAHDNTAASGRQIRSYINPRLKFTKDQIDDAGVQAKTAQTTLENSVEPYATNQVGNVPKCLAVLKGMHNTADDTYKLTQLDPLVVPAQMTTIASGLETLAANFATAADELTKDVSPPP